MGRKGAILREADLEEGEGEMEDEIEEKEVESSVIES